MFRQMGVAAPSEERAGEYRGGNEERGDAAWLMLQILESRHPRSETESEELAVLSQRSKNPAGVLRMTYVLKQALPPQPHELASLYPITSTSTATAQRYLRAQDATLPISYTFADSPCWLGVARFVSRQFPIPRNDLIGLRRCYAATRRRFVY
ncbi:MAG: hypothetical protein HC888_05490 [Candidatus Competibacteraceae bacterium]|nr:hypothetical protein [Candidatus Competibacteraceae bacterium]